MPSAEPPDSPRWYRHEGVLVTAFATGSHAEGAQLGRAAVDLSPAADVDVCQDVVRVRLPASPDLLATQAVQLRAASAGLGLVQAFLSAEDAAQVRAFWR